MAELFRYGNPDTPAVLIQPVDDRELAEIAQEIAAIQSLTDKPFQLIAVRVTSWNADLSPWYAPAVFGSEDFGGSAQTFLPELLSIAAEQRFPCYLGGYSLAGLFALWAAYQTDLFCGIAAASPSVWFPDFTDYMRNHRIRCRNVYLSIGDREARTRNAVMATVENRILAAYDLLQGQDVNCVLERNPGNHFKDAAHRTAKAFAWILQHDHP